MLPRLHATAMESCWAGNLAVGESSVTLLHPPLPSAGAPPRMERQRQQSNRTLVDGYGYRQRWALKPAQAPPWLIVLAPRYSPGSDSGKEMTCR